MSGMNETPKGNRTHIAAVGCEVSRVGRSTVYNRTRDAPVSRNGLALCYNGGMKNAHVVYET